jgi:hypothetical protein
MLNAGFGSTDITPEHPTPLAGFGKARTACHEGIHDRISANCVFFRNGSESVAVLSCEVIGLRAELCERIRELLPASLGLDPVRLFLSV